MKIKLTNIRLFHMSTRVDTTYMEDVWITDEHHPEGNKGYFLSVEKHYEYPVVFKCLEYTTDTKLDLNSILESESGQRFIALEENKIVPTEYTREDYVLRENEEMIIVAQAFTESTL